ncbi:ParA family protein [Hirschia maritima]|uniref:ParA family protein n=1 Tax=Hirschia maritima TaxID=1121961 RepID=UPI0003805A8D|nr:ParA family protein [Hirschia maritima]
MTAIIAAIANLKGGVGKSTTTVMLADGLSYFYGLNVCVVDLDAQANSSQMLLTERGVQMAYEQGKGATHLLSSFIKGEPANVADFIMPNAVSLEELRIAEENDDRLGWISSLPSHPHLRLQEMGLEETWYSQAGTPTSLANKLAEHFKTGFDVLREYYDIILFDCPPHLSPLARAGLSLSDVFVMPTIADAVSTWGTKQFSDWVGANVAPDLPSRNFVLITRFRNTGYSKQIANELQEVYLKDRWFGPKIPESVHVLNAMERAAPDSYDTFRGKYGGVKGDVKRLSERFTDFLSQQRAGRKWQKMRD